MVNRKIFFLLTASALFASSIFAQDRKAGLTGAAFLKVGVGARAVGLGSAVTALSGDVNQMFWNPAGIALQGDRFQAVFNHNNWIAGLSHNSAAASFRWDPVGTVGVGFVTFGLSGISADRDIPVDPALTQFQIDGGTSPTYDYLDAAFQLSIARFVTSQLALGLTAKVISQTIDGHGARALAFDFGSVYHIGLLDWTIGARFNNLGADMKYYDIAFGLPLSFSIGTAMVPLRFESGKLLIALDAVKPQDGPQYLFSGAEFSFLELIALRGGWKFNYSGTEDDGTSFRPAVPNTIEGLSLGAGITSEIEGVRVNLDYSYTKMNILSAGHRITLQMGLK